MDTKFDRRKFLKIGAGVAAGTFAMGGFVSQAVAATCGLTPPQTPGPFYPGESNFTAENDLTRGPGGRALGQVIYITGVIADQKCSPVAGANIEIWQACASGRYNNSKDPNTAPLDPNFRYWGEAFTGADGSYSFKSILPGAYPADTDWMRPAHIHVRVAKLGYRELVTQMYFKGDQYNDTDLILQNVPADERERVIVDFQPAPVGFEPGSLLGKFDLAIQSIR